jgi:hypothetical protein
MFIAALFTIAKLWEQPRSPTTDEWIKKMWYLYTHEWIKKMWYLYTTEFYSVIKKNEIMLFAGKWMELENFILSEVNQTHSQRSHAFPYMWKIDL